jgi:hypothetical protein
MRIDETLHGPGVNIVWELSFSHGRCAVFVTGLNDGASIWGKTQINEFVEILLGSELTSWFKLKLEIVCIFVDLELATTTRKKAKNNSPQNGGHARLIK